MEQWWKSSVVYQIYPRSFQDSNNDGIGDIPGIIQRLDYLVNLGIDVIWISPIYASPNYDNGYDISDYQAIMDDFGTMEDFDILLETAHQKGLKIIMDLVINHSSHQHPWFIESRKSTKNPYRDYYIWKDGNNDGPPNNWGATFGGSAWQYDETTNQYYLHMFVPEQPDLNWENPTLRKELHNMITWWCEKGVDGFRMDAIGMISKADNFDNAPIRSDGYGAPEEQVLHGPNIHIYLQEINNEVFSKYDLLTVGETADATIEDAKKYAGENRNELNMVFHFEHVSLTYGDLGKWTDAKPTMPDLRENMSKWQTGLEKSAWNSLYLSNHDQPRSVSTFGNDCPAYRELSAKMLATCLHFQKGTPYIYQGEELGMTNAYFTDISQYRDIDSLNFFKTYTEKDTVLANDMIRYLQCISRDNARTPMQWNSGKYAGFSSTTPWIEVNPNYKTINAQEQLQNPESVFHYYKKLIALRKQHSTIVHGRYELLLANDPNIWAYKRIGEETFLVLLNFTPHNVPCILLQQALAGKELISNHQRHKANYLQPYEAIVSIL